MCPASKSGGGKGVVVGVYDGSESKLILSISEISYLLLAEGAEVN